MEALFLILAELIILPLTVFATLLVESVASFCAALASFLGSAGSIAVESGRKTARVPLSPEALAALKQQAQRRRKIFRRLAITLGGILIVMLVVVGLLNTFFFETTVRWGLSRVEKRSGIKIEFATASGNLFTGAFTLKGVTAQREGNAVSNFDVRVEKFTLDLRMTKLLARSSQIEKVFISGLHGDFHRVTNPERVKIRKHYRVEQLRLENVEVTVRDTSRSKELQFALKIAALESQPLRSRFAVFDILFRSNARGEIAGQPFLIQTQHTERGRETVWQATGLPMALVGQHIGGPFDWLQGGTVDVRVEDTWKIHDAAKIEMHWSFVLRNLEVVTPEGISPTRRLISSAIAEHLRINSEKLDVSFSLTLNENQFEGAASAGAAGLWDATRDGFVRELSRLSGADPERVNQGVKTGIEFMKRHLDNSRKKSP